MSSRALGAVSLAFLISHELDAVLRNEWRMLPLLSFFDDTRGFQLFTLLHVPIFAYTFYRLSHPKLAAGTYDFYSRFGLFHMGLHVLALWCPRNSFTSWTSWTLIAGAGIFGALDIFFHKTRQG